MTDMVKVLTAAGMSEAAAGVKGELFRKNAERQAAMGRTGGELRNYYVPGRLEFLGKHTDYAGGRSLVCPIDMGICLTARGRSDSHVRVVELGGGQMAEFELAADAHGAAGHWSNYPMTVARRIARNFGQGGQGGQGLRGADIVLSADLPPAAGMSSSSALMVATFLALAEVNSLAAREEYRREIRSREDLACYLGTVENGQSFGQLTGEAGVGTFGGSEDHTAMLCGQAGVLSQYSFCPTRFERTVPLPADCAIVVAVSGVLAEKTGAARDAYNRASLLAREVFRLYRAATGERAPSLGAALTAGEHVAEEVRKALRAAKDAAFAGGQLLERFEQFHRESCLIIPAAGDCLAAGDLAGLGRWVDQSQSLAEGLLGNQVPETIHLASSARRLGALAASAFGAGFGGSVWAMVEHSRAREFVERWAGEYRREFPARANEARFVVTRAGPAAIFDFRFSIFD